MSLKTIGEVAREFGVSTRMLRYYDETGLLPSIRADASPYCLYDEESVMQLQRILLLKSLRIPLKQIAEMLRNPGRETAAAIFRERTQQIEREIAALQSVSHALKKLAADAPYPANTPVPVTPSNEIASERLCFMNMTDSFPALAENMGPVRILYLPPCTVAAFRFVGESPEERAEQLLTEFAESSRLSEKKPDLRVFGFNNPSPRNDGPYGYEFYATIPEEMEVPAPGEKKFFPGGLYAAHCIKMGDFQEWSLLSRWAETNGVYEPDPSREPDGMGGCLEEHLNPYLRFQEGAAGHFSQLDLLIPIRKKEGV